MKDELIELQTQMSFQEDTVAQLNDVVTRQQQEIDQLKLQVEQLKKQMQEVVAGDVEGDSGRSAASALLIFNSSLQL
ncbi:SlyX family protein [Endozoicomonas lisbonensis]|uniref:SlyX family protein n=1 Tax=Endozoicomonas lisbonensis TaxID=3120522 RepID=UPI00339B4BF5